MRATKKNRDQVRQDMREQMLSWYIQSSGFDPSDHSQQPLIEEFCKKIEFCEDIKPYASTVYYWIDPPIPGVLNPMAVEEDIQGIFSIKLVPRKTVIRSVGGI